MNWFEFNFVTLRVIMRYKIKKRREKKRKEYWIKKNLLLDFIPFVN